MWQFIVARLANLYDARVISQNADFVRRPRLLWLALGLVLVGAVLNVYFLFSNCPLDLAEDESHYWLWAQHLDYGYYSKPAGIAWVMYAAQRVAEFFGYWHIDHGMPALRLASIVFGLGSGLLSALLASRIWRDDRAAIAVIALSAGVPMFAVGSLLITIDAPMYFCWAAAVYCLWRRVESPSKPHWLYTAAFFIGLGMLFKPVLIAIPLCLLLAMRFDATIRAAFNNRHALFGSLLILLMQTPVVIWNYAHDWVTFRHIGTQGGLKGLESGHGSSGPWYKGLARMAEYLGGQAGGMGGIIFVLLVIAIVWAVRETRNAKLKTQNDPTRTRGVFLLAFALPLWLFYFFLNLVAGTQPNWPATSYFAAMILMAGWVVHFWPQDRGFRFWIIGTILFGVLAGSFMKNTQLLYPTAAAKLEPKRGTPAYFNNAWHPRRWDLSARIRGLEERGQVIARLAAQMKEQTGREPLIAATRWDDASSIQYYLPGRPFVFSIMSAIGGRESQYDIWPGLDQRTSGQLVHAGRDVLIIGDIPPAALEQVVTPAFDRLDAAERVGVEYHGLVLRELTVRRAYGFKGWPNATPTATTQGAH